MDLKSNIKAKGWTISAIAKEMRITQSALSQQLNNNTMSIATLEKVANIMGVSVACLVSDEASSASNESAVVCPHCGKTIKVNVSFDKE